VAGLVGWVLLNYYKLLLKTVRVEREGFAPILSLLAEGKAVALGTPHTLLLIALLAVDRMPATFLASQSRDGGLISAVLEGVGFRVVRGSSSRGGVAGLAAVLRSIEPGRVVGLTFDGPKGPPLVPKKGVGLISRRSSGGLFLLLADIRPRLGGLYTGCVQLRSWDRFHLLLPFSRVHVRAVPIPVGANVPEERVFEELESLSRESLGRYYSL
jgi:lysophospholipid acyltransferase (LPLAT)-like uncharacterized protein